MATLSTKVPVTSRPRGAQKPTTPFAFYVFMGTLALALVYFLVLAIIM